jgi:PST family polysaccharide transporter
LYYCLTFFAKKQVLKKFKHKIQNNAYLNNVFFNTGWLFLDRFYRMGLGLLVGVWVARYLGPSQYGDINYALAFVTIVTVFTTLGLDNIAIRELVNGKKEEDVIGTTFYARLGVSLLTLIAILLYAFLFLDNASSQTGLVIVFSFISIFQSFDAIDLYFQSIVRSKFSVYAKNIAFTLSAGYRIVLVVMHASVFYFGLAMLLEFIVGGVLLVYYYQSKTEKRIANWRFNFSLLKEMLSHSWPLILSSVSVILYMRLDQVMLGQISTSKAVGDYSAASKLVEVWYFIPTAITSSLYPFILKSKSDSIAYEKKLVNLYSLLLWGSVIAALATTLLAKYLIAILFGNGYMDAVFMLQVYIWSVPATFMGLATSQYLMAENLTRISFLRTFIGMVINIILNYLFIPKYGGVGAALATVISYTFATFSIVFFKSTRYQMILIFKALSVRRFLNVLILHDKQDT